MTILGRDIPSRVISTVVTLVLSALVIVMASGLAYTITTLASQGDRLEKVVAANAKQGDRLEELVGRIQQERVRNIRSGCADQNDRNKDTKRAFRRQLPPPPGEARRFTFALLDALAPVRDCDAVVQTQTGGSAPTP